MSTSTKATLHRRLNPAVLLAAALLAAGCASTKESESSGTTTTASAPRTEASPGSERPIEATPPPRAASTPGGNAWSRRMDERRRALEQAVKGSGVEVSRTPDNRLKLVASNEVAFSTGSVTLKPQLRGMLDPLAASLRDDTVTRVTVIGHTDSTGSEALNDRLSLERAKSVRDYLVSKGVAATRVEIVGRGPREPIADNAAESGRARNRRVEIYLNEAAA